jgi:hypothetical protein
VNPRTFVLQFPIQVRVKMPDACVQNNKMDITKLSDQGLKRTAGFIKFRHVHQSKDASILRESLLQDLQRFQVAAACSDGKRSLEQSLRERESNS